MAQIADPDRILVAHQRVNGPILRTSVANGSATKPTVVLPKAEQFFRPHFFDVPEKGRIAAFAVVARLPLWGLNKENSSGQRVKWVQGS